jgi:predicted amidohydrolase YtcJ
MCLFCDPATASRLSYRAAGKTIAQRLEGPADIILHGGPILTMDELQPDAEALSVRDGLVQFVGPLERAMAHKARSTRVIDLGGRTLIPGMVLDSLSKDPLDLLDWQDVDLRESGGDLKGYLASTLTPPLFSEPIFVRLNQGGDSDRQGREVFPMLEDLYGPRPIAIETEAAGRGLANRAMLALVGAASDTGDRCSRGVDLATALRPFAMHEHHTVSSHTRMLANSIANARNRGFTTVIDRAMGALGGRAEIEAAAALLGGRRQVRINAVAHRRLREEWDGRLPADTRAELLSVDTALIEASQASEDVAREAQLLDRAGWRLALVANDQGELEKIVKTCAALKPRPPHRRHRLEIRFPIDPSVAGLVEDLEPGFCIENQAAASPADTDSYLSTCEITRHFHAMTRGAARRFGLGDVAGSISAARSADFTIFEGPASGALRLSETWIEGIPI